MANEEHLAILRQGVEVWNAWRKASPPMLYDLANADLRDDNLQHADLRDVDLSSANLSWAWLMGADLSDANLSNADLSNADLSSANLSRANLVQATFDGVGLGYADLRAADLSGSSLPGADLGGTELYGARFGDANLSGANLTGANLNNVNLSGANLNECSIYLTTFINVDLSKTQGLDTINHQGPSSIGIDTLVKSKGQIPKVFLRGCGVPESFIEYLPSLLGALEPIQFYSCFISYSNKDEEFAKRLHSKMRDNNLRVWFANEDLKGGHKLHEQIDKAIRMYDKFIIVLSPESLRSKWVMNEVRRTRKAELSNNQRKFFPIALMPYRELEGWECIDPETGTDLAAEIREYYVPDFRDWKNHDSFEKAFAQLLEGLKAVDARPAPRIDPKIDPSQSKKRRLRILEDQQARMGGLTPPYIIMEIEDLRKELIEPQDSE